jgi:hypothetical protein
MPAPLDFTDDWKALLRRRAAFADVLSPYTSLLAAWAEHPLDLTPPAWTADACAAAWRRGVPLIAESPPDPPPGPMEALLEPALAAVAAARPDLAEAVARFATAWDRRIVTPAQLLPRQGRLGSVPAEILDGAAVAFLVQASLRPVLERWFEPARERACEGWALGICPLCGAPPTFADIAEDGRRSLACTLCGGARPVPRLWCPLCGNDRSSDLAHLRPDALPDQGYAVATCGRCRGAVKELDRRTRWNGGPPLLEDWASPHLDVAAARAGYWRAIPTLVDLASGRGGASGMW